MSADHTPEPWNFQTDGVAPHPEYGQRYYIPQIHARIGFKINGSGRLPKLFYTSEQAEADCRRIVACVNACKGIETEKLERVGDKAVLIYGTKVFSADGKVVRVDTHALAEKVEILSDLLREIRGIATANESWSVRVSKALGES